MSLHTLSGSPKPDRDDSGWVGAPADDDLEQRLAAEDEPFDERQPHVMTALGAIPPAALGATLFGSWDRPVVAAGRDPGEVLIELERLYATGVRAVVDLAAVTSAQQLADLAWISQRSPVHLVIASGPTLATETTGALPRFGITRVESMPALGDAEAGPHRLLFVRAETWSAVAQLALPRGGGGNWAGWTIIVEPANATSGLVQAALAAGARLVVIVGEADAGGMAGTAALIRDLVELGFGDRLSLGYNADPIVVMERFPLLLMDAGLPAIAVRRILVDNPAEALTRQAGQP